jgi:hypothetical protein
MTRSSSSSSLPPAPASPARIRTGSPSSSRPLTTDAVARRFIAGHLGIKAPASPERKEYDKLVRAQARQAREEREKEKQKAQEDQKRQQEELNNVWDKG